MPYVNQDIGPKKTIEECYENLVNAVIYKASEDYRAALRKHDRAKKAILDPGHKPSVETDLSRSDTEIRVLERFFRRSEWMELTDIGGEYLINEIRKDEAGKTA